MLLFRKIGLQWLKINIFGQKSVLRMDFSLISHLSPDKFMKYFMKNIFIFRNWRPIVWEENTVFSWKCRSLCSNFHAWTVNFTRFGPNFNFLLEQQIKRVSITYLLSDWRNIFFNLCVLFWDIRYSTPSCQLTQFSTLANYLKIIDSFQLKWPPYRKSEVFWWYVGTPTKLTLYPILVSTFKQFDWS